MATPIAWLTRMLCHLQHGLHNTSAPVALWGKRCVNCRSAYMACVVLWPMWPMWLAHMARLPFAEQCPVADAGLVAFLTKYEYILYEVILLGFFGVTFFCFSSDVGMGRGSEPTWRVRWGSEGYRHDWLLQEDVPTGGHECLLQGNTHNQTSMSKQVMWNVSCKISFQSEHSTCIICRGCCSLSSLSVVCWSKTEHMLFVTCANALAAALQPDDLITQCCMQLLQGDTMLMSFRQG